MESSAQREKTWMPSTLGHWAMAFVYIESIKNMRNNDSETNSDNILCITVRLSCMYVLCQFVLKCFGVPLLSTQVVQRV